MAQWSKEAGQVDTREKEYREGEMASANANLIKNMPDLSQFSTDYFLEVFLVPIKIKRD